MALTGLLLDLSLIVPGKQGGGKGRGGRPVREEIGYPHIHYHFPLRLGILA